MSGSQSDILEEGAANPVTESSVISTVFLQSELPSEQQDDQNPISETTSDNTRV